MKHTGFEPFSPLGRQGIFVPGTSEASLSECESETREAALGLGVQLPLGPTGHALPHSIPGFAENPTGRAMLALGGCQHPSTVPWGLTRCQAETPGKSRLLCLTFSKGHVLFLLSASFQKPAQSKLGAFILP